jgi:hypothetical protein
VERRHVLPDGRGRRRHAARHLRAARRDHAVEAARLGARPRRRLGAAAATSRRARCRRGWCRSSAGASSGSSTCRPVGADLPERLHPESPKFLLALGRIREAHASCSASAASCARARRRRSRARGASARVAVPTAYLAQTVALSVAALAWG